MSDRRRFIAALAALGGAHAAVGLTVFATNASSALPPGASLQHGYPFSLGVASGSPSATGVVLWTRIAPQPWLVDTDAPPLTVRWELARDESFREIVRGGEARAEAAFAHSVHVELEALAPNRHYWYRFFAGDAVSPIGRTRTLPEAAANPNRLRFAYASCQNWQQGLYGAYHHMLADEPDLVIFLGDYIYEGGRSRKAPRQHSGGECRSLEDYRLRHAMYKTDPALQAMHAAAPWILTWDDHEVSNDYADDRPIDLDPAFLTRRAAAYQAYYEHMPLRRAALPGGKVGTPALRIHERFDWGRLARFHVLDGRQFKSHQPCAPAGRGGANTLAENNCADRLRADASFFGRAQEAWLEQSLAQSAARWNVLAQQTLMAQIDRGNNAERRFWTDGWDGYPAARRRLIDYLARNGTANPVVIGGDVHSWWVCDLKRDFDLPDSPVVASEFCGTSISSTGPSQAAVEALVSRNPHVRYARGDTRGYTLADLEPERLTVSLRGIDDVWQHQPQVRTVARFVVEDGKPGPRRVD